MDNTDISSCVSTIYSAGTPAHSTLVTTSNFVNVYIAVDTYSLFHTLSKTDSSMTFFRIPFFNRKVKLASGFQLSEEK